MSKNQRSEPIQENQDTDIQSMVKEKLGVDELDPEIFGQAMQMQLQEEQQRASEEQQRMKFEEQRDKAMSKPVGENEIKEATETLKKYKNGKENLDQRIIENEQWFKLRHWEVLRNRGSDGKSEPVSAWLFNSIANKHADAMDNYPEPCVLARAMDDEKASKQLTNILPVVLEYNDYEQVYSDTWWYKLKQGTGVKKVVWNSRKNNGIGDIDIQKCDLLNLFWEPGITDIQKSRNFFHVELVDNDLLMNRYRDLELNLGSSPSINIGKYMYDDTIDTSDKSAVIDWYYKSTDQEGKEVLHYVQYVNNTILYASENDPECAMSGFYEHGQYPYVFDTMFVEEGTPTGFGYIDVMKDAQMYIDKLNKTILENAILSSKKRYFVREDGTINEDEFADYTKDFVHTSGNLGEDSIREIENTPISDIYVGILNNKIEELKETSGNRDFSQGSTSAGVTAASAIAALQEAGSKLSRDMLRSAYRSFAKECYLVIELIRQFYDEPRCFRITGEKGEQQFTAFDNSSIKAQPQGNDFGIDLGSREPVFDVEVSVAKKSTYSRMSQNELALQFYGLGFFNPEVSDQALSCLDMMDFDGKEKVVQKISENGTLLQIVHQLQQQMLQMSQIIDMQNGTNIGQGVAQSVIRQATADKSVGSFSDTMTVDGLGGASQKNNVAENAKERVQGAAQPR